MVPPYLKKIRLLASMTIVLGLFFSYTQSVHALTDATKYPRISNYYLRAGIDITPETIPLLARYDLVILPAEAQIQNPTLAHELRLRNPDIVLLAYVPTVTFNRRFWNDTLHQKLLSGVRDEWWLRDTQGNRVTIWQGTEALNIASPWAEYLARFVKNEILSSGMWDGIFYDEVDACITCRNAGDIDTNRDGNRDNGQADTAWQTGYVTLLTASRSLFGPNVPIITNGNSNPAYQPPINGRMFESFPTPWETSGRWEDTITSIQKLKKLVQKPELFILDNDTQNTGINTDYRDVRFGLASALMVDAYHGYSSGTENHGQLWWYDEYDIFLGRPTSAARPTTPQNTTDFHPNLWRRDFEKGIVLVNSTGDEARIRLGDDFEKLHGTQDSATNDGAVVSRVTLKPTDGLVLLRVNDALHNVPFTNGWFTRIVNKEGNAVRTGFFTYDDRFRGGDEVIRADFNNDKIIETVHAREGRVSIYNTHDHATEFAPYGNRFNGEIRLAVGDVTGDGAPEIITAAGPGGGPHIRVWTKDGVSLGKGFFAFDQKNRGGATVAIADIDGDGKNEIITGAGRGLLPEVRTFNALGTRLSLSFLAYSSNFRAGITVATGDVTGDGTPEIITGTLPGGGPHVRLWSADGKSLGKGFFPYDQNRRDGVRVGVTDRDDNGVMEILTMTANP